MMQAYFLFRYRLLPPPESQSQKKFFFGQTIIFYFLLLSAAAVARKLKSEGVFFGRAARMADSGRGVKIFTSFWSLSLKTKVAEFQIGEYQLLSTD